MEIGLPRLLRLAWWRPPRSPPDAYVLGWLLAGLSAVVAEWLNPSQPAIHIHNIGGPWFLLTLLVMAGLIALIRRFVRKPNSN